MVSWDVWLTWVRFLRFGWFFGSFYRISCTDSSIVISTSFDQNRVLSGFFYIGISIYTIVRIFGKYFSFVGNLNLR